MLPEIENYPPPAWKGKYVKIKYVGSRLPTRFPAFALLLQPASVRQGAVQEIP